MLQFKIKEQQYRKANVHLDSIIKLPESADGCLEQLLMKTLLEEISTGESLALKPPCI